MWNKLTPSYYFSLHSYPPPTQSKSTLVTPASRQYTITITIYFAICLQLETFLTLSCCHGIYNSNRYAVKYFSTVFSNYIIRHPENQLIYLLIFLWDILVTYCVINPLLLVCLTVRSPCILSPASHHIANLHNIKSPHSDSFKSYLASTLPFLATWPPSIHLLSYLLQIHSLPSLLPFFLPLLLSSFLSLLLKISSFTCSLTLPSTTIILISKCPNPAPRMTLTPL